MFTVALLMITSNWEQHEGPAVGEWLNKLRFTLALEYYLALKKSLHTFSRDLFWAQKGQLQNDNAYLKKISFLYDSENDKMIQTENRVVVRC